MIAVLRTIVWAMYFVLVLIVLLPPLRRAERMKREGDTAGCRKIVNKYVVMWMGTLMRIAGCKVEVSGLEHIPAGRAVVFTPNHQGDYDIPIMLTVLDRPHPFVAKMEADKIPLVRSWMRLFDCVFLDREDARQAIGALRQAQNLLEGGESVIVFPEGTRSRGGDLGEFKGGAFRMAFKAGAPVVPVVIDGSYRIMEANHNLMKPGTVRVTFLPPIETAGLDRASQKALPEEVRQRIAQAKDGAPAPQIKETAAA